MTTTFTREHLYAVIDGGGSLSFLDGRRACLRRNGFEYITTLAWQETGNPFMPHVLSWKSTSANGLRRESLLWPVPTSGRVGLGLGDAPFEIDLIEQAMPEPVGGDETPLRVRLFKSPGDDETAGRIESTDDLPGIVNSIGIGSRCVRIELSTTSEHHLQVSDVEKITEQFVDCGGRRVLFVIARTHGGMTCETDVLFERADGAYRRTLDDMRQSLDPSAAARVIFEAWQTSC